MGPGASRLENMDLDQLRRAFNQKKVLVTGHTGLKGAWLITLLNSFGSKIKGYSLASDNTENIYDILNCKDFCVSIEADVRNKEKIKDEILDFEPDIIFHLAAQPLVRSSYSEPLQTFETNCQGTVNVLEALRYLSIPCVAVFITTDKVYSNLETGQYYVETDRLGGHDPYSASKACAEIVIESYRKSFFNPLNYEKHLKSISVARAGNVIGGGDWSLDRIIPDIVRSLRRRDIIKLRNPNSVRPWQHVLEPLLGYLILAAKQSSEPRNYASAFNFGPKPNDILPVSKVVDLAIQHWGYGSYAIDRNLEQPHEATLLHLNITKANKELGWRPLMDAGQAIKNTINWYQTLENNPSNIEEFTFNQISNYLKIYDEQ